MANEAQVVNQPQVQNEQKAVEQNNVGIFNNKLVLGTALLGAAAVGAVVTKVVLGDNDVIAEIGGSVIQSAFS